MRDAINEAKHDDEVPTFLTDIELVDDKGHPLGKTVSMEAPINELSNLSDTIMSEYLAYAKQAVSDFLRPFFGDQIQFTAGNRKGQTITIDDIISEAPHDISILDMWLDTMADSSDLFLQLFDSVAKQANDNARTDTILMSKEINRIRMIAEEQGITDFEWMFEKGADGRKTGNYISMYNIGLFWQEKKKFIEHLNRKYGDNPSSAEVHSRLDELRAWNTAYADPADPDQPAEVERWVNQDFVNMTDTQKQIYDAIMKIKWEADSRYPDGKTSPFKAIQRRKSAGNRIVDSIMNPQNLITNIRESLRQSFVDMEDNDQLFGAKKSALTNFDKSEYMTVPVLYTTRLKNPDDLSTDIFSDLLAYTYSSNQYTQIEKIVDPLEVARSLVTDGTRGVGVTRGGSPVQETLSYAGRKIASKVYQGNSNIERKLNEWMATHIYQRHIKDEGVTNLGILKLNNAKLGNWILKTSSVVSLGFNYLANMANVATGVAMTNIEAAAGEYFNARQLLDADRTYFSNLPAFLAELGSRNKTNFLSLFKELFNIKADFPDRVKKNTKRNILQKLFGNEIAYLGQDCGDHWLYTRVGLAFVKNM